MVAKEEEYVKKPTTLILLPFLELVPTNTVQGTPPLHADEDRLSEIDNGGGMEPVLMTARIKALSFLLVLVPWLNCN